MGINHVINEELVNTNYKYKKLHSEHDTIEKELKRLNAQPRVDTDKIRVLKRKKLFIADEMFSIENMKS